MGKILRYTIFVLPLIFLSSTTIFANEGPSVEVIYVSGSVEICKAGETVCKKAEVGMLLYFGDKIKTHRDSSIELAFDENNENVVRVESDTFVVLMLKENEKMELIQGEVFLTISKLPSGSSFEIRTPTAIAGVRGTDWVTKIEEESTVVEAIDGNPYVKGIEKDGKPMAEETVVLAGHMTKVKKFQKPLKLEKLPFKKQEKWKAVKGEVRKHAKKALQRKKPPKGVKKQGKDMPDKRRPPLKPSLKVRPKL